MCGKPAEVVYVVEEQGALLGGQLSTVSNASSTVLVWTTVSVRTTESPRPDTAVVTWSVNTRLDALGPGLVATSQDSWVEYYGDPLENRLHVYRNLRYTRSVGNLNVRTDAKTDLELEQLAAELGLNTSDMVRKAIHLAWFAAMQDRMRRESAEIALDPAEQEEAARIREWARYLAS